MSAVWPEGKRFAFTVFDDTDSTTLANGVPVYRFLAGHGFRTTKSVWPVRGPGVPSDPGLTCDEPEYRDWVLGLQAQGFEIGYHMATSHTSEREETRRGLDRFRELFGHSPRAMANHFNCRENIYFGDQRVSGVHRLLYNVITRYRNHGVFRGEVEGDPRYWGDLCHEQITYCRNFVFHGINTLKVCPEMPYHDPERPLVRRWFASSEGAQGPAFLDQIREANQDRLEEEGGCCIMYTHFGLGFVDERGRLSARFEELMRRLSRKNGWFAPVSAVLDHLAAQRGVTELTARSRRRLERRWLADKLRHGTA
jgi:hypothetical protein